jgi:hypothetical protein
MAFPFLDINMGQIIVAQLQFPRPKLFSKLLKFDRDLQYTKRVAFCSLLPFTISGHTTNRRHCRLRFTYSSVQRDITACMKATLMAGDSDKTSAARFVK